MNLKQLDERTLGSGTQAGAAAPKTQPRTPAAPRTPLAEPPAPGTKHKFEIIRYHHIAEDYSKNPPAKIGLRLLGCDPRWNAFGGRFSRPRLFAGSLRLLRKPGFRACRTIGGWVSRLHGLLRLPVHRFGYTPGKRLLGLRVVGVAGFPHRFLSAERSCGNTWVGSSAFSRSSSDTSSPWETQNEWGFTTISQKTRHFRYPGPDLSGKAN